MTSDPLPPIPIPPRERLRDLRQRVTPVIVFGSAVLMIAWLWKGSVASPMMVGQAEPVLTEISSYKPGLLAEFTVSRFQIVKSGDSVGQVLVTDPKILASTLAVIQAEIEMLRINRKPIAAQQQTAMDYDHLELVWMKQRADLAAAKVNLQLATTEYRRMDELFKDKIISQRVYEQARAAQDRLQNEVTELTKLVAEGEANFKQLHLPNTTELSQVSNDPLVAAIAVQEAKLRLAETELSPVLLRAPMDGVISVIYRRPGEAVAAGQPIASIATATPVRIVGYLRPPISAEPKAGMRVEVRTRGMRREAGMAEVIAVGAQLELIPPALSGPFKLASADLGLPVDISLPPNLHIRPGELVDIRYTSVAD